MSAEQHRGVNYGLQADAAAEMFNWVDRHSQASEPLN